VIGDLRFHCGALLGDLLEPPGGRVGRGLRLLQVGPGLDDRRIGVDEALLRAGRVRHADHAEAGDRHGQGRAGRAEPEPGGLRQGRSE